MRSVKADKKIYKLSADPEYRAKHPHASMVKKRIGEIERGHRINPIFEMIIENRKTKGFQQDKQYKEQVEELRKLLASENPWIKE